MRLPISPCPTQPHLEQFLLARLPDSEQADVDLHLERCPDCQKVLDRLVAAAERSMPVLDPPRTRARRGKRIATAAAVSEPPANLLSSANGSASITKPSGPPSRHSTAKSTLSEPGALAWIRLISTKRVSRNHKLPACAAFARSNQGPTTNDYPQSHKIPPPRPRRRPDPARMELPPPPEEQQAALRAIYDEVGFARSLLAYELPDGRLKLIDGHLRRDIDPDMEVDVEILDVNDEEARALLLSIDPLASLAETQEQLHRRLLELTPTISEELRAAWQAAADKHLAALPPTRRLPSSPARRNSSSSSPAATNLLPIIAILRRASAIPQFVGRPYQLPRRGRPMPRRPCQTLRHRRSASRRWQNRARPFLPIQSPLETHGSIPERENVLSSGVAVP